MKLSQTLLNAIFIGMTAGAVTSCTGLTDTVSELHEDHKVLLGKDGNGGEACTITPENCPACGLG